MAAKCWCGHLKSDHTNAPANNWCCAKVDGVRCSCEHFNTKNH